MASLLTAAPHGIMARRLLVIAVIVPLIVGYVRVVGERRGLTTPARCVVVRRRDDRPAVFDDLEDGRRSRADRGKSRARRAGAERPADLERAARQKAEQADRAKDEFIAALSHELRTPLNAILGWIYMLRNAAVPDEAKGKAAEAVVRNAGLLARLIEDLLDTSRITTGRLELAMGAGRPWPGGPRRHRVGSACVTAARCRCRARWDATIPSLSVTPTATAGRLEPAVERDQVQPPGETVIVGIAAQDGFAVVTFATGVSGSTAFLPQVFERFQQADLSTHARTAGWGWASTSRGTSPSCTGVRSRRAATVMAKARRSRSACRTAARLRPTDRATMTPCR